MPDSTADRRTGTQWLMSSAAVAVAFAAICVASRVLTGHPDPLTWWLVGSLLAVPIGETLRRTTHIAPERILALTLGASSLAVLASAVFVVIVGGIVGPPHGGERTIAVATIAAAAAVAVLAIPARARVREYLRFHAGARTPSTAEVVTRFEARMSRAVPMDELLLQLSESLRATTPGARAEIWTATDDTLTRAVSSPSAGARRLQLGQRERVAIASARIGGPAWIAIWLPDLHDPDSDSRVVPVAHLGELLGLLVVHRPADGVPFTDDDEAALVDVARQLGLALHNVRLDSALQASLAELAERNAELQASRLRIVNASDATRREIERNLHDGAQQHLVSLAVKLGIARILAHDDPEKLPTVLDELRAQVQATIGDLRELAHGIYPPLLRDRGLDEALNAAAGRLPIAAEVDVDLAGRHPEAVEAAAYFCCLEAMQNAVKYAGADATLRIAVRESNGVLTMSIEDDGAGFDPSGASHGQGFTNMRDRLGALGGALVVDAAPGAGTRITARIPSPPVR